MLQKSDGGGGDFYHTSIIGDKKDYSLLGSLVEGRNERLLKKLEFEPGTLSLFMVNNVNVLYLTERVRE